MVGGKEQELGRRDWSETNPRERKKEGMGRRKTAKNSGREWQQKWDKKDVEIHLTLFNVRDDTEVNLWGYDIVYIKATTQTVTN